MSEGIKAFQLGDVFRHHYKAEQHLIDAFQELSGDINPVHVDPAYARQKGFKSTIVFGNALGFGLSYLIGMALPIKEVIILKQTLEYHHPVYAGDEVRIQATVDQIAEAVDAVSMKLQFNNQDDELVAKGKILIKCL